MNRILILALLLLPSLAHAHPGHGIADFSGGLIHPFLGLDHLMAAVAVGLWAAQLGGISRWALPLSFVGAMGLGLVCGLGGYSPAGIETCIVMTILILGAMVAAAVRLNTGIAALLVAGCAFFHGLAHGLEAQAADAAGYAAGLFLSTALLHIAGVCVGVCLLSAGRSRLLRAAGAGVFMAGIWCGIVLIGS